MWEWEWEWEWVVVVRWVDIWRDSMGREGDWMSVRGGGWMRW